MSDRVESFFAAAHIETLSVRLREAGAPSPEELLGTLLARKSVHHITDEINSSCFSSVPITYSCNLCERTTALNNALHIHIAHAHPKHGRGESGVSTAETSADLP